MESGASREWPEWVQIQHSLWFERSHVERHPLAEVAGEFVSSTL